ncbi:MAG TPA: type II secretion system minor pseudopilin GspI [Gammaproteobacteria bacterium]|jgi:general secretion pathway protein I|nr:type II secretion system minor pseudopilin GspI [Gammaproteobacteria bacterium]
MRANRAEAAGFTLLEVMVALVIVALGMTAVVKTLNTYAVSAQRYEDKTLATWIASNKITELSVDNTWPAVDEYDEELDYAKRHWKLHVAVAETEVKNLRRVDVSVSPGNDPDRVEAKVSGLIEPPAPRGFPPVLWPVPAGGGPGEEPPEEPGNGPGIRPVRPPQPGQPGQPGGERNGGERG